MLDIKDQMIEEEQDRRERMHRAVDDIEAMQVQTCPAEYCDKSIDKHCFIAKHFDWCLEHQATSLESDGTYDVHRTFKLRNDDGSEEINTEIVKERKCSHPDAREYGWCNVVQSDYGEDEWEEEERIEWMSEQMAKDSP